MMYKEIQKFGNHPMSDQGLLLVFRSGKHMLIGTQRAGDLIEFLEKTR